MARMIEKSLKRLQYLCETLPPLMLALPEKALSLKPGADTWSKKEILGHLIDSAANNHQRFIRVQYENVPHITYNQNDWNRLAKYHLWETRQLISFWTSYNTFLVEIIKHIPEEHLTKECNVGHEKPVTLQWLIDDYVRHLEHHANQIVDVPSTAEMKK